MQELFLLVLISSLCTGIAMLVFKVAEKLSGTSLKLRSAVLTFLLCFQPLTIILSVLYPRNAPPPVGGINTDNFAGTISIKLMEIDLQAVSENAEIKHSIPVFEIAAYIWLIIALIMLAVKLLKFAKFYVAVKESFSREIKNVFSELPIYSSRLTASPFLMGVFYPVIVIPETDISAYELKMIIRHETVHFRRHDIIRKTAAEFLKCVNWFDPMFYLLANEIGEVTELIADNIIMENADHSERKKYGLMLLKFAEKENRYPHSGAYLSSEAKKLTERLEFIMKNEKTNIRKRTIITAAFIAVFAVGISASIANAATSVTPPEAVNAEHDKEELPVAYVVVTSDGKTEEIVDVIYGVPPMPPEGFEPLETAGISCPSTAVTSDEFIPTSSMYLLELDSSDNITYSAGNISYGNGQMMILCESGKNGFSLEKDQTAAVSITADFSDPNSFPGEIGELVDVGYIYNDTAYCLYRGRVDQDGLTVELTAQETGEYHFFIINACAGLQNYKSVKVEKY